MKNYSIKKNILKTGFSFWSLFLFGIVSAIAQPLVLDGGLSQTICGIYRKH